MSFFLAVLGFAALVVAFIAVERLFRSPVKPAWIDNESVVMAISVAFTGGLSGAVGAVIATSLGLPFSLWGDVALALAVVFGVIVAIRGAYRVIVDRDRSAAI